MKTVRIIFSLFIMTAIFTAAAYAAETNFTASSLTAQDVDCKKCHTDTPHVIHANKPVDCVNCHGDKLSVSVPRCTKCHDGPIHQVHAGKVSTQSCSYCHKNITGVHNALTSDAVCSHCHKDLVEVHGNESACTKCHSSPPEIVKPLKLEGSVLVCQNCHAQASVATIHGATNDKTGCYNCHKGTSQAQGSEVPHVIHATKVECKGCHEENGKMVVPQCTRCHDIDKLHAFNTIGKLTSQSGLQCPACHPGESNPAGAQAAPKIQETTSQPKITETAKIETTQQPQAGGLKVPGFAGMLAIAMLATVYLVMRRKN